MANSYGLSLKQIKDLAARTGQKLPEDIGTSEAKASKYGNIKETIECPLTGDMITFDSQRELNDYLDLCTLQKYGHISELKRQIPFVLIDTPLLKMKYIADFTYMEKGEYVVADSKGMKTAVYLKKKKLMLKVHGITIRET